MKFSILLLSMILTPILSLSQSGDLPFQKGYVKWFNATKGYGFITPESEGKDVFVHISAVERAGWSSLRDDQCVLFTLETGRDGRSSAGSLSFCEDE